MKIWLGRDGQRFGPYTKEQLVEWVDSGRVPGDAPAWIEGSKDWTSAAEVLSTLNGYRYTVEGYDGQIDLWDDRLVIRRGGALGLLHALSTGTTSVTIPIYSVKEVEFRGANPIINGAICFISKRHEVEPDQLRVYFKSKHQDAMSTLKRDVESRAKELAGSAERDYAKALEEFRSNPTDATLRARVLAAGRTVYGMRRGGAVTVYDEMALSNELAAAASGAPMRPAPQSVEQRLERLEALREKGLVSDEEYAKKRQEILDSL
jgi:hypothetical protein